MFWKMLGVWTLFEMQMTAFWFAVFGFCVCRFFEKVLPYLFILTPLGLSMGVLFGALLASRLVRETAQAMDDQIAEEWSKIKGR